MLKLKSFIIALAITSLIVTNSHAINVNSVGPSSGSLNYCFTGDTHYGQAEFDGPYHTVYWYVRGPGETGLGTIADIDYGDGTSTVSYFSHTFDSGSTSGEEYEITAYVYPDAGAVDWDSYTVDVWTPAEEVITTLEELTITDDIKIGDYYAFNVDATSSHSGYVIDEIEVFVDAVSQVKSTFSGVAAASLNVAGYLPTSAGSNVTVTAIFKGALLKGGIRLGAVFIFDQVWTGVLKGTLYGFCECKDDGDELDNNSSVAYTCTVGSDSQERQETKYRDNSTSVTWTVSTVTLTDAGTDWTLPSGKYSFPQDVPFGFDITLWLKSDDLHDHGKDGEAQPPLICKYEEDKNIGKVGNTVLRWFPRDWGWVQKNFSESPVSTYDPCVDPYPVKW